MPLTCEHASTGSWQRGQMTERQRWSWGRCRRCMTPWWSPWSWCRCHPLHLAGRWPDGDSSWSLLQHLLRKSSSRHWYPPLLTQAQMFTRESLYDCKGLQYLCARYFSSTCATDLFSINHQSLHRDLYCLFMRNDYSILEPMLYVVMTVLWLSLTSYTQHVLFSWHP